MNVNFVDLGLTEYKDTWELQQQIHALRRKGLINDTLLFTQHQHVYTLGKSGSRDHLLLDEKKLGNKKISYFEIDRGGDITYHGPGQLVAYPIFDLNNYYKDVHRFLRSLEQVIIDSLKDINIDAYKDEEFTGVWVGNKKICAIGIKVSGWVTMHGLAFNIKNDITMFDNIIPCGIFHKGVTSVSEILGPDIEFDEISRKVLENFQKVFKIELINVTREDLFKELSLYSI